MDENKTNDQLGEFFKNFGQPNQNIMTWLDRVHVASLTVSNIFKGMVKEIDGGLDPDDQKMLDDITDEQKSMMEELKNSDEFAGLFGGDAKEDGANGDAKDKDDDQDFPELFMNALSFACYDFVSLGAVDDETSLDAIQEVNGSLFGMEGSADEIIEDIKAYDEANMPRFYEVLTNLLNQVTDVARDMPWVKYTDESSNSGIDFIEMYSNLAGLYFTYKGRFDAKLEVNYREMLGKIIDQIKLPVDQSLTDSQKKEIINTSVQTIKDAMI